MIWIAIESRRGCGYRKVGGLYLVGTGLAVPCDRLPYNVEVCPVCGQGIKFSRALTWISGELLGEHEGCTDIFKPECPVCSPLNRGKLGLMWVGSKFYTPESFTAEARKQGVCKRIASVPKGLKFGETWVLLAHPKAGLKEEDGKKVKAPAIFYAFRPTRIDKIIRQSEATPEEIEKLQKRGITPVAVPDNDQDHAVSE